MTPFISSDNRRIYPAQVIHMDFIPANNLLRDDEHFIVKTDGGRTVKLKTLDGDQLIREIELLS